MRSQTKIQGSFPFLVTVLACTMAGCSSPTSTMEVQVLTPSQTTAPSPTPSETQTPTNTATSTPTFTPTPTITPTPSITPTPTITLTPTITPTPTFDFPDGTIIMQANCRYGPGVAYMWSHGLYPGDTVIIHNRNHDGSWLWIKPDTLNRHCWASEIVMEIEGDVFTVVEYYHPLPHTTFIGPATNVQASRSGNQVTVTWDPVHYDPAYDLRGYLLEVTLCQNGSRFSTAVHTDGTSYTFTDDANCSRSSSGQLWTAEKHGYTDPVQIPWP